MIHSIRDAPLIGTTVTAQLTLTCDFLNTTLTGESRIDQEYGVFSPTSQQWTRAMSSAL
jgi:hypothetical protein